MIRKGLKILGILFVLLIVADIVWWQIADRMPPEEDPDYVERGTMETSTDYTVSYLRERDAEPEKQRLIYVHGTPGESRAFLRYLRDPIDGFDAISIDRPGFGQTKPLKHTETLETQARAIEPFLVKQGGEWPILVGHSLGGPIIAQVAAMFPERVGGLVILSGSLDPELEKWQWYNEAVDWWATSYLIPGELRRSNRELKPMRGELEKLKPLLQQITCPVVIVHAPDDMLVPWENVDFMKASFPKGTIREVVRLENRNHFLPWNSEADVRKAIESLQGGVDAEAELAD